MSMIRMKRLQAVLPEAKRDMLLKRLMALGCVEITAPEASENPHLTDWLRLDHADLTDTSEQLKAVNGALAAMTRFCKPEKTNFLTPMRSITHQALVNPLSIAKIVEKALYLNHLNEDIDACHAEEGRILTRKLALTPWQTLNVPLETKSTPHVCVQFGVCPASAALPALEAQLLETSPLSALTGVSSDEEQHYLFLLYHQIQDSGVDSVLKEFGFSPVTFKGFLGTALDNLTDCDRQIRLVTEKRASLEKKFEGQKDLRQDLETCFDALSLMASQESIRSNLLRTTRTLFMTGWVPEDSVNLVAQVMDELGCAFEFSEPKDQDEPPVAFQNTRIAAPFGIISGLYGTPRYRSIVDPTPFMAPFFFVFFGIMVSDVAYGLILALFSLWVLRQQKQDGFLRQLFVLVLYCGISTMVWGLLFGSWFGDFIPAVSKMLMGTPVSIPPLWFDPLKQPMSMLIFSFVLGGIQILVGLGLAGWRLIKTGHTRDAIFDVGFWYMILIGLIMGLLKLPYGLELAAGGALGVVLTSGRKEKNPLKRILIGFISLYGVTGYLADVLSYSRLLALGLASSVIASVINTMGTIGGKSVGGIIGLIVIFIFGHLFNLAINLVGAYVHASRLQYVEFFSKFYEGGGKPFSPFAIKTKYVQVDKHI